jgi:hypothetical protein
MRLPRVDEPQRYQGLYVYDFGEWTALGYTAEEIAVLLEAEAYRGGKVYKIHRAWPDGQMELRGVSRERFLLESGMFFYRTELEAARADFAALSQTGQKTRPPCRAYLQLADRSASAETSRFVTALIYPAEHEDEIGRWLLDVGFAGGDLVEGGASHVSNYYGQEKAILDRQQLWSNHAIPSRSPEQVLASVRNAVQR